MMPYALADGYMLLDEDVIARAGLPDDLNSDIQLVIETACQTLSCSGTSSVLTQGVKASCELLPI